MLRSPVMIAMYLIKQLTGASLTEIGRAFAFAGKHNTTVRRFIREIERQMETDEDARDTIQALDLAARIRQYVVRRQ